MCHLETETLTDCNYFNNGENLPIYSRDRIDVKQIPICLNSNVSENLICKKCPLRVNENATFIIHQDYCNIKHPFHLQVDNIGGTFTRKGQVRFNEAVRSDSKEISLSSEVHLEKENGKVIGGKINSNVSRKWEQKEASLKNVYVVVRKRAEHKKSRESGASLVRYIIFVLTLEEYNSEYSSMSKLKCFLLNHKLIILSYQTLETEKIEITEEPHGNTKKKDALAYRPITHSSRNDPEDVVLTSPSVALRHLLSHVEQIESSILEETNTNPNI